MDKVRRLGDYSGDRMLGGPDIAELARRYEAELQAVAAYDFNDLMRHAVAMLREHEWLRRLLVSTYAHLYVDEYQDLPPSLDDLVRALCFDQAVDATLFAVGDPDQAIFGFMGTRPELLHDLASMPGVTDVALELNYRCGKDIVTASLLALGQARTVRSQNDGGEIIIEAPADGPESQRHRAVELVEHARDEGVATIRSSCSPRATTSAISRWMHCAQPGSPSSRAQTSSTPPRRSRRPSKRWRFTPPPIRRPPNNWLISSTPGSPRSLNRSTTTSSQS